MDTHTAILGKSPVFGGMNDTDLARLVSLAEARSVQPGEILATAGERAARFFILISGTLLVALDKGKALVLKTPGDFIGLNILSERGIYKSTITALTQGEVLGITRDAFLDLIQEEAGPGGTIMAAWNAYLEDQVPFLAEAVETDTDYHY